MTGGDTRLWCAGAERSRSRYCVNLKLSRTLACVRSPWFPMYSRRQLEEVPVCPSEYLSQIVSSGVRHAIVAAPELSHAQFVEMLERVGNDFPHMILIPDTDFLWKVGSQTQDLMGVLGLQVRNNLLDGGSRIAKRAIDLTAPQGLALLLFPLMAVITLLIAARVGISRLLLPEEVGTRRPELSHLEV